VSIERDFLSYFTGSHVYCVIDDKKVNQVPIHYHEGYDLTRDSIIFELHRRNEIDNGIFFCVNEIDRKLDPQKQRTSKMLKKIRAVWADDDLVREQPRSDFPIPPNIVVETSKGKFHYYWLTSTDNIEQWGYVMNGIASKFDTDGNAKDLVRVLRVPGFLHQKHDTFQTHAYLGSAEQYSWDEVISAFPPNTNCKPKKSQINNTHVNVKYESYTEARQSIVSGTNFHGAIMWLLNHWVNCGIKSPEELRSLIENMMSLSEVQDDRWEARTGNDYLNNNVRDAIQFVQSNPLEEDIVIPEIEVNPERQLDVGYPPGQMGDLCRDIYAMAPHPNEEVALMAGFALVAGIVGRSYNILGTGLNLYVALLADSGIGKATLKNAINKALLLNCAMEGGISFKGASRFTGPKSLLDMLSLGLSRVCVLEESGLLSESTAGDQKGLSRVMLDIFSSSGKGEYAGGENYSKAEQNIPVIPSPALTIAHVSTPLSYLRALKARDAVVSGDIARIWIMRSMRLKKNLNTKKSDNFSPENVKRIKEIVKKSMPQQSVKNFDVVDLGINYIDIQGESDRWTEIENNFHNEGNALQRTLASRAFIKILKIAGCASVYNGLDYVGVEEYKWAQETVEGELGIIGDAVSFGASDDMGEIFRNMVAPTISKIINGSYSDPNKVPPKTLLGKGMFTGTNLNQALKNNEVLKRMNDDPERPNPRSGLEKIVSYMLRNSYITLVAPSRMSILNCKAKVAYKVTSDFVSYMEVGD
jgi:hypothetical protein